MAHPAETSKPPLSLLDARLSFCLDIFLKLFIPRSFALGLVADGLFGSCLAGRGWRGSAIAYLGLVRKAARNGLVSGFPPRLPSLPPSLSVFLLALISKTSTVASFVAHVLFLFRSTPRNSLLSFLTLALSLTAQKQQRR